MTSTKRLSVVAFCASCALMQMVSCVSIGYPAQYTPLKLADVKVESSHSSQHQQAEDNHSTDTDAFNDEKKMHATNEHKSTDESLNENQGNVINENRNVETEESGEIHKSAIDEDDSKTFHEDGAAGSFSSKSRESEKDLKRSFEKGFFNQYHKKEYHKLLNFFGNEHMGGEYIKYGNQHAKKSSESEADEKGKHGNIASEESVDAVKHPIKLL